MLALVWNHRGYKQGEEYTFRPAFNAMSIGEYDQTWKVRTFAKGVFICYDHSRRAWGFKGKIQFIGEKCYFYIPFDTPRLIDIERRSHIREVTG